MSCPYPHSFTCQLPAQDLLLAGMTHTEALGTLGATEVLLLSPKEDIDANALLGTAACVSLKGADETERHLHGIVSEFAWVGTRGRHHHYRAVLRPWLWFLSRTADCRIFQDLSVPEIVQAVFADHSIAHVELRLYRAYATRTYCVQYRETDLAFVQRLLEEEGIHFHFEHEAARHRLVLADDNHALDPAPVLARLPYFHSQGQEPPDYEHISHWECRHSVQPGKVVLTDYDFTDPVRSPAKLRTDKANVAGHELADAEVFDYPGGYTRADPVGQQLTDTRLEQAQLHARRHRGQANTHELYVGHSTELTQHPRADQNGNYLITALQLHLSMPGRESEGGDGISGAPAQYSVHTRFEAIALKTAFRPERRTPKPFVQGPQTAVVVGPAGEEIHTDEHGRVKLQFHWDRLGRYNERSSCWVRVSSPWAGHNFGAVHIPRIGQEVIVDFLEGDPDRPIITGRVYNAEQMPPWELPANKTQSGILTRSSKGGAYANANEIRFEDLKGAEELLLHAERNQRIEVEHDESHWVGNDRTKTIDRDETTHVKRHRTETVDAEETITIHGNRTEVVDRNETITIHQNRNERVDLAESVDIGTSRSMSIGASETLQVGASKSDTIGGSWSASTARNKSETVGAGSMFNVAMAHSENVGLLHSSVVGAQRFEMTGMNKTEVVGASRSATVKKNDTLAVTETCQISAKRIVLTGEQEIVLSSGGSTVKITPELIESLSALIKLNS